MSSFCLISCSSIRPSFSPSTDHHSQSPIPSSISLKSLQKNPILQHVSNTIKKATVRLLDTFVDSTFEFLDQPLLPSQSNFGPVEEIGEAVDVSGSVNGLIPDDFPVGVYIRNGPNPLFGGLKSTKSIFGKSRHSWIEGEGMLHALYFSQESDRRWNISYRNRHVETDTFVLEKARKKPAFLPAIEGDSLAILSAYLINHLRFGFVNKFLSNTNVFEHSGKLYSISENHIPQEINILTLQTTRNWDINGSWDRPFTSHPKKDPETGELVIMGIHPEKPYFVLGVISADGNKLVHKVDLKLNRCCLCHEIGITARYNVIIDFPVTIDINRVKNGGPLIKYNKEGSARIGIMPRYGDADSVKWFNVKTSCTFHIINCYEEDDEVVVLGCRAHESVIPEPELGFQKEFKKIEEEAEEAPLFSRAYEWRLNLQKGDVRERNLTGPDCSMDFPMINHNYTAKKCKYAYTQFVDPGASSASEMPKYGGLAKLHLQQRKSRLDSPDLKQENGVIEVEQHKFPKNTFCSGSAFVAKRGDSDAKEDDGWIITYVHNEDTNTSQVYIVDAKNFSSEPVAIIDLPTRVPYGFHGAFMPL